MFAIVYLLALLGAPTAFGGQLDRRIVGSGSGHSTEPQWPKAWLYSDAECNDPKEYSTSFFIYPADDEDCQEMKNRISIWVNPMPNTDGIGQGCIYTFDSMDACKNGDNAGTSHPLRMDTQGDSKYCYQFDEPGKGKPVYWITAEACDPDKYVKGTTAVHNKTES